MRVLFIIPSFGVIFHYGIAQISSVVKEHGHKADILQFRVDQPHVDYLELIDEKIASSKPDLIALASYELTFPWIQEISKHVKENHDLQVLVGGYYSTLDPEEVIKSDYVDMVCRGEGEYPLLELLECMESGNNPEKIKNLWFKKDGKIMRNDLRPLISDLDSLPFMDRELFDYPEVIDANSEPDFDFKPAYFMATRGCPFDCTYCSNHILKKIFGGDNYARYRSVDNILEEINQVKSKYDFTHVIFDDDLFILDRKWFREFADKYPRQFDFPYCVNLRPELCNSETMKLLKKSGCTSVHIGVESGDEEVRRKLGRNISDRQIINSFRLAHKHGLETLSFNMLGLPFDTRRTMLKTFLLNLRIRPTYMQFSVYYPLKHTRLGDLCYENGWVDLNAKEKSKGFFSESILNTPRLSREEVNRFYGFVLKYNYYKRKVHTLKHSKTGRKRILSRILHLRF